MEINFKKSDYPKYHVTEEGEVWSRKIWGHCEGFSTKSRLLKPNIDSKGRPQVSLINHKGIKKWFKISRLVALIYIPNPLNKPCVCHKDNNPLNNHCANLYWGTHKENMEQAAKDNRMPKGELHSCSKISNINRSKICSLYAQGNYTYLKLGVMFNLSQRQIGRIIKTWRTD